MDDRNIRRFERAIRVQTFGNERLRDFDAASKTRGLFRELDPLIDKLRQANVGQLRDPVGKATLIAALSEDFKDIARTARAIKLEDPTFDDSLYRHPATSSEIPVTTHADSLLKHLEDDARPADQGGNTPDQLAAKAALRARFIAYEIAADFVEDLRADRDALDACNAAKHSDRQEGIESTSAIDTLLGKVQDLVSRLDAAIQNKYRRDPDTLAAWKAISRVERTARKEKENPGDPTPPPTV